MLFMGLVDFLVYTVIQVVFLYWLVMDEFWLLVKNVF